MSRFSLWPVVCLLTLAGCGDLTNSPNKPVDRGIIGQKTQDIGEYDATAGRELSSGKIEKFEGPVLGPLQAYGPILEEISKLAIDNQLALFNAEHGRFPKDHEEFMEEIIRKYNIELPVLPAKHKYQYDVENHKLVVVKPEAPSDTDSTAKPGE